MRSLFLHLIWLLSVGSLAAQSEPKLAVSIQLVTDKFVIGDASFALIKILNEGNTTVYVDQDGFEVDTEFQYPGVSYLAPGVPGPLFQAKGTKENPDERDFCSSRILVVEPGQSFIRLIQVRTPRKSGRALLHAYVFVPATTSLQTLHKTLWPHLSIGCEYPVEISPINRGKS